MTSDASKVLTVAAMRMERDRLMAEGKNLVTNSCFDILHRGHVTNLNFARSQGDALAVAVNSNASLTLNKGDARPIHGQEDRTYVVGAPRAVDYVVYFDEQESKCILSEILPQMLVRGSDWAHYVSGREVVEANGGRVVLAELFDGRSTTGTIEKFCVFTAARLKRSKARSMLRRILSWGRPVRKPTQLALGRFVISVEDAK